MSRILLPVCILGSGLLLCAAVLATDRDRSVAPKKQTSVDDDPGRLPPPEPRRSRSSRPTAVAGDASRLIREPQVDPRKVAPGVLLELERAGRMLDGGEQAKAAQLLSALAGLHAIAEPAPDANVAKAYLRLGELVARDSLRPSLELHCYRQALRWMDPGSDAALLATTSDRIAGLVGQGLDGELELQSPAGRGVASLGPDAFEIDNDLSTANPIGFRHNGLGQGNQTGQDNRQVQRHTMWPERANEFDDIDVVKFQLNQPAVVRMETAETEHPSFVDSIIGLTNSAGQPLAANDDQAPGDPTSAIELCLNEDEWLVSTLGFFIGQTFEYDVAVEIQGPCAYESEPNGACEQATPLPLFESIHAIHTSGFISGDQDWYRFEIDESTFVRIATDSRSVAADTTLTLYAGCPDGPPLAFDDDGGPGLFSLIQLPLDAGTYYVNTQAFSSRGFFPYSISVEVEEPPTLESEPNDFCFAGNPVELGATVIGAIVPAFDFDYFRFSVPTDRSVEIQTFGNSDTVIQLSNVEGENEIACDDDGGDGLLSFIGCCLEPGDYCVGVKLFSQQAIGNYRLELRSGDACTPQDPPACISNPGPFGSCAPFDDRPGPGR